MNKELARDILAVIDSPFAVSVIERYADYEIAKAHTGLESSTEQIQTARLQGVILACREMKRMRDRAIGVKEHQNGNIETGNSAAGSWS